jgi:ankyrin repeat protein
MEAALNGRVEMVDALLAAGADKTRMHPNGKRAADFARDKGHADLAKRLE